MSAQPCGCDPDWSGMLGERGWMCERHTRELSNKEWNERQIAYHKMLFPEPTQQERQMMGSATEESKETWNQLVGGYIKQADHGSGGATTANNGPNAKLGIGGAPTRITTLPDDPKLRKQYPLATGFFDYFPDAIAAVAHVSWVGNEQHNPGQPLHWDRSKSTDEDDTTLRHFAARGTRDTDGCRHLAKAAWRVMAALQKEIEQEGHQ